MKIVQLIVTLQRGDAIGNYTLILDDVLQQAGYDTFIYALNVGRGMKQKNIRVISQLPDLKEDDLIIYQLCEGNAINEDLVTARCKKIAIYHNVTPPEFFSKYGAYMEPIQEKALREIEMLRNTFDLCIADSEFNKQDLISMGYDKDKIKAIPIILDYKDFERVPDQAIIQKYGNSGNTNFLFVGRIVPNKKQENIIRAFAFYKKQFNSNAKLFLVGTPFSDDYYNALNDYIAVLGLKNDVIMTGHISFEEILGFYSVADIFLCMSEHEGFCVPLLEAMLFHVPILAYDTTAIKYTLNGSGVLLQDNNPVLFANIADYILKNDEFKQNILLKQNDRLRELRDDIIKTELLEAIESVIGEAE